MNIQPIGQNATGSVSTPAPSAARPTAQASGIDRSSADQNNSQGSKSVSSSDLNQATQSANELVQKFNNNLKFNVDHDTGRTVVKVVDTSTQEVIKQIPSEEMLELAKALDQLKGLLVKQQA